MVSRDAPVNEGRIPPPLWGEVKITPEGYQNYGAVTRVLGTRVDALTTMTETLSTEDVFEPSFARDVCKHCDEPISYYPGEHQWLHDDASDPDNAHYCREG